MSAQARCRRDRSRGALLGTTVGDALGLPAEGLSRRRAARLIRKPWRHRFLFGHGMISDDTEHTVMVAQALLASDGELESFVHRLSWSLRWWICALPAGIGMATLRATLKLWLGFRPPRAAVFSAGNGPAMRVSPIAVRFAEQPEQLEQFVNAASTLTHSDPRAATGAKAVAHAIAWGIRHGAATRPTTSELAQLLGDCAGADAEWDQLTEQLLTAIEEQFTVAQFAEQLGQGEAVTGYAYHTVPLALHAWFCHYGDFATGLTAVLDLGGDTDTIGAITGGMLGAATGEAAIPQHWLAPIVDWPRGTAMVRELADRLVATNPATPVRYCWPAVVPRNLLFLATLLAHGLRRLAPPY